MKLKRYVLSDLFRLMPGSFHATWELDPGDTPLVSCGWENNGVIGYYDIPESDVHERALTVAFNGAPLTTHFHPYRFGAKDDVAILEPLEPMSDALLIYVAAALNSKTWRYSYGRKCYREKLAHVEVALPVDTSLPSGLLASAYRRVKDDAAASIGALFEADAPAAPLGEIRDSAA